MIVYSLPLYLGHLKEHTVSWFHSGGMGFPDFESLYTLVGETNFKTKTSI